MSLSAKEHLARVTYYWGDKHTSTGAKPTSGVTAAVDPKVIPYGSKISIPEMKKLFIAQDTGPAVVSKKASRGKNIVVDIFCRNAAEAHGFIKKYPMYMKVQVEEKKKKK